MNKSEISELNSKIKKQYNIEEMFSKKDRLTIIEHEKIKLILKDKDAYFFYHENDIVPTLKLLLKNNFLKQITVDMGAVKFVASGADIMRPGITKIEEGIEKNDFVIVIDETHKKPLAVAQALYKTTEMQGMEKGKVLKNIHYIGDKIWNYN